MNPLRSFPNNIELDELKDCQLLVEIMNTRYTLLVANEDPDNERIAAFHMEVANPFLSLLEKNPLDAVEHAIRLQAPRLKDHFGLSG